MTQKADKGTLSLYARYLFYAVIAAYPFHTVIRWLTGLGVYGLFRDAVFLGLALVALLFFIRRKSMPVNLVDLFVLGYVVLLLFSAIKSPLTLANTLQSLRYRIVFLLCINLFFKYLRMNGVQLSQVVDTVLRILFFTGVLVSLLAFLEVVEPELVYQLYEGNLTTHLKVVIQNQRYTRVLSTLANPINLGFYLVLSSVGGLYLLSIEKGIVRKALSAAALLLMLAALLFTYSRGAYVTVLALYGGWLLAALVSGLKLKKLRPLAALLVVIAVLLCGFFITKIDSPFTYRLKSATPDGFATNQRALAALDTLESEALPKLTIDSKTVTPSMTDKPGTPIATDKPGTPIATDKPSTPIATNVPSTPIATNEPSTPFATDKPSTPIATDNPSTPIATDKPSTLDTPAPLESLPKGKTGKWTSLLGGDSLSQRLFGRGLGVAMGSSLQYVFEIGYFSMFYESGALSLLLFLMAMAFSLSRMVRSVFVMLSHGESPWLVIACIATIGSFLVTMVVEDTYMQMPYSLFYPIALFAYYDGKANVQV